MEGVQIVNADGTNLKTISTGAANGTKITAVMVATDDTGARDLQVGITRVGPVFYPLGTKTIPIGSGTTAAAAGVNLLDPAIIPGLPIDSDGQPYLFLENGQSLQAKVLVAVTAAKTMSINAVAADF